MTAPLLFLAFVTCFAGFIPFGNFVSSDGVEYTIHLDGKVALSSVGLACVAIGIAFRFYRQASALPAKMATAFGGFYRAALHRFYIDNLYLFITKRIIFAGISQGIAWFDRHVIDGAMNLTATVTQKVAYCIRGLQSGQIQQYAFVFLIGTLLIVVWMVFL